MEIKISDELNNIIRYAREEAMRTGSYGIGPDHLFLGMMRQADTNTCSLKITSSHKASVLCVTFSNKGTNSFLQSQPANHANRKAITTRMA